MKKLLLILAVTALGGCAVAPPGGYYANRGAGPVDANGWQVVSVTPVAAGTGAQAQASGDAGAVTTSNVQYAAAPVYASAPVYAAAPVYVQSPYYAPSPYLYDPYWYAPVSIGLGFNFGGGCCRGGGWGGGHAGWGGGRGGFHHR